MFVDETHRTYTGADNPPGAGPCVFAPPGGFFSVEPNSPVTFIGVICLSQWRH